MRTKNKCTGQAAFLAAIVVVTFLIFIGVGPLRVAHAIADTIYVDAGNPCAGAGTLADPYCSIQLGVDNASMGDIINIASGNYNETITLDDGTPDNLTISGDPANLPVVDGGVKFENSGTLDGLKLEYLYLLGNGNAERIFNMVNTGAVNNFTMDNCVLDGENVAIASGGGGRYGIYGNLFGQTFTITNTEFKNILGWALMDIDVSSPGPPIGGNELPLTTVTFSNNYIHNSNGTVALRGNADTRTTVVNAIDNRWADIGGNAGFEGFQWAAMEINNTMEANVRNNTIKRVLGQCFELWNIDTLDLSGNDCLDSDQGIFFFSDGVGGAFCGSGGCPVPGGYVSLNNIAGNIEYGILVDPDSGGGPLNAECNWWGDSNGPSGEGPGSGDFVSENAVFSPWSPVEFRDKRGQRNAGVCNPSPIPTLSEWGLMAMAGVLGIVGFMVMRRKKVTA